MIRPAGAAENVAVLTMSPAQTLYPAGTVNIPAGCMIID